MMPLTHLAGLMLLCTCGHDGESAITRHWLWSKAYAIPAETTSEQSGYFSLIQGKNGRIYLGTAKYGENAFLVEYDPRTEKMSVVVDAQKEIGSRARGFAAQAKIHTRNNIGSSGKIYFGTKQGYPKQGEKRTDYPGGQPMVFDPKTGLTQVYPIPEPHQGIISVTPDESRNRAYVSTCSDERPVESTHFMILDLRTGNYRDLMDCEHMYAFVVVDYLGRAYHPIRGGEIARFDPQSEKLERLKQTIDGTPPVPGSLLAHPQSHPINWDLSPDGKTLYAIAMGGNQLYSYDLTKAGDTLPGRALGKLVPEAIETDCRAMCVGPDGTVWAGVAATFPKRGQFLHLASYRPDDKAPIDHGPIAIGNPIYSKFTDLGGKPLPYHHGVYALEDGTLLPRYSIMGICAAHDGTVYITTLCPFTLHAVRFPKVIALATTYYHNSHADLILTRLLKTDTLQGHGQKASLQLRSIFVDQVSDNDISQQLAAQHGVSRSVKLQETFIQTGNIDGVLLVAEHGDYPTSQTGQTVYPKRKMFEAIINRFDQIGRVVPVFIDKHLADNWTDAKWIYDAAKTRKIPLMAGSSVPVTWRDPAIDLKRGAKVKQIVAVSYHTLDGYGFHALEAVQALAERRGNGETGVRRVQCLVGPKVWEAEREGVYDRQLLEAALARQKNRPIPAGKRIEELVKEPILFVIEYLDGLRVCVFTLNDVVADWSAAWRYADGSGESTRFCTQEERPFGHFTYLLMGIERMIHTGNASWPVERTLLTSGILDAALISKKNQCKWIETPYLAIPYESAWNWQQPSPPVGDSNQRHL